MCNRCSNLPPGVTESMLPGNRPEDVRWDEFVEAVSVELAGMGLDCVNRFDEKRVYSLIERYAGNESDPDVHATALRVREALEGE